MSKDKIIQKAFYSIKELARKWKCKKKEVLHEIGLGNLEVFVKYYGDKVAQPILGHEDLLAEEDATNEISKTQSDEKSFYQLHDEYIPHLIKDGAVFVDFITCESGRKSIVFSEAIKVTLDELVVMSDEVGRFEAQAKQFTLGKNKDDAQDFSGESQSALLENVASQEVALPDDLNAVQDQEDIASVADQAGDMTLESSIPITAIAKIFWIVDKGADNQMAWKKLLRKASKNGLDMARTKKGIGKAQSLFDPIRVGDWLVTKKYFFQYEVNEKLANHFAKY